MCYPTRSFTAGLVAGTLSLTAPAAAQDLSLINLFGGAVVLGQGYDTFTGQLMGFCVDRTAAATTVTKGPQEVSYDLDVITHEEFERRFSAITVAAGGSFGGIFSASGSHSSSSDVTTQSTNFHVILSVEVRNAIEMLDTFALNENAVGNLGLSASRGQAGPDSSVGADYSAVERASQINVDPSTTQGTPWARDNNRVDPDRCGDAFVYAKASGGILYLVATVKTKGLRSREEAMTAVSASGSYSGISADVSTAFFSMTEKANDFGSVRIRIFSQGPWTLDQAMIKTDPEAAANAIRTIVKNSLAYPTEVVGDAAWDYRGYLMPYGAAGENIVSMEERAVQRTISAELSEAAGRYWRLQAYLANVQADPSLYEVDPDEAEPIDFGKKRTEYIEKWRKLTIRAGNCRKDGDVACAFDPDVNLFPTVASEGLPEPIIGSFESALCNDERNDFLLPNLVPARVGCFDSRLQAYWAGTLENVRSTTVEGYCAALRPIGATGWRLPTRDEVRLLLASRIPTNVSDDRMRRRIDARNKRYMISLLTEASTDDGEESARAIWATLDDALGHVGIDGSQFDEVTPPAGAADGVCVALASDSSGGD